MVLLREIRPEGLVFFTNYESDKGVQLLAQPRAALCFHWDRMERQVRVEGSVSPLTPEESDAYFLARPRKSRIASASSPQSARWLPTGRLPVARTHTAQHPAAPIYGLL